jgi:DNA protecting protein DprA
MTMPQYPQLRQIRGIGEKRYKSIVSRLGETNKSIDDLFKMSADEIKTVFKLPINVAQAIASWNSPEQTPQPLPPTKAPDELASKGIRVLSLGDKEYPERVKTRLGNSAPKTLYVWGNLDLLDKPAVGFCGSRNASEKGLEVTADTAKQIAELGWVVVSGHARGVDVAAHKTAVINGGSTIIVAPEGILVFKLRQELKKIAKPEQILIISEFAPKMTWNVRNAMTRNRTIIGLSDAMILVEARNEGGTFEAGKSTLSLNVPLYVVEYQMPGESAAGNPYFLKRGAISLRKSKDTGRANIEPLINRVQGKGLLPQESENKPQQLALIPEPTLNQ